MYRLANSCHDVLVVALLRTRWVTCGVLMTCLTAVAQDNNSVASRNEENPGVASIQLRGDEHAILEALHGARRLARVGAGYEAARVVAAIAEQMPDTEPGHEANRWLEELELGVDVIRKGTPNQHQCAHR